MKRKILDEIVKRCRKEAPNHPERENFLHWTFLLRDNSIISYGVNRRHEPPKFLGYHTKAIQERGFVPKWHSELDSVKRAKAKLYGCVAVNVRLNKSGQIRLAMPCQACRNLLYYVNCKRVYFTTEYGWGEYAY
jgi:tRNA(Arg) A34 adenosine deaminase TadA